MKPLDPPRDVAAVVLERAVEDYAPLPKVERIVEVPVCVSGGDRPRLLTTPGLDVETGIYYLPPAELAGVAPLAADSTEDVEWAHDLLMDELLGDFRFADDSSRAHALALLLLPFVRDLIRGSTPLHAVLAPDYGAGKTWLAQAALMPGCGPVGVTAQTKSEEEWRKRITSKLLSGASAVLLDNFSGTLDSGALATALTSSVWVDRILGESKEVTLPIRNAWVVTGNNLDLADEQIRRSVPIFLDPGDVRASDLARSEYRHPDLLNWAEENRRELVTAALTLIEHWRLGPVTQTEGGYIYVRDEDGGPQEGRQTLGSFERWAGIVGGILEAAGTPGLLANRDRLKVESISEDTLEGVELLEAWEGLALGPVTVGELADHIGPGGTLTAVLPTDVAQVRPEARRNKLAYWLRERRNQKIGSDGDCFQPLYDSTTRKWDVRRVNR
jgi:hypothetical protein